MELIYKSEEEMEYLKREILRELEKDPERVKAAIAAITAQYNPNHSSSC